MFDHIAESCDSHGHHFGHGGCHGTAVHDWHKDGVTVSEFGAGESQEAPFTMLDETIRFRDGAACLEFTAGVKRIDWLKAEAKAHGKEWKHGHCANKPVHCENSHGFKICAAHAGVDVSDIIELDSIHADFNGVCHDATGNKKDIQHAREYAEHHGHTVKDGKCKDSRDCHQEGEQPTALTSLLTVCRGNAEAWDGSNTVHGAKDGYCIQFRGAAIKNGKVDDAIAAKFKTKGVKLMEGGCRADGFTDKLKQDAGQGISYSIWKH